MELRLIKNSNMRHNIFYFSLGIGLIITTMLSAGLSQYVNKNSKLYEVLVIYFALGFIGIPLGLFLMIWAYF